jgi:hypothetical protein
MDWTPTQKPFHIRPPTPVRALEPTVPVPSFSTYQRLPPAPKSLAARIRNPLKATPYFKSADTKELRFFQRTSNASPLPPQEGQLTETDAGEASQDMKIAPPKFFPSIGQQTDTGLEGLFTTAFKLGSEPVEVVRAREQDRSVSLLSYSGPKVQQVFLLLSLLAALVAWNLPVENQLQARYLHQAAIVTGNFVATINLLEAFRSYPSVARTWTMCTEAMNLVTLTGVGAAIHYDGYANLRGPFATVIFLSLLLNELKKCFPSVTLLTRSSKQSYPSQSSASAVVAPMLPVEEMEVAYWRETTAVNSRRQRNPSPMTNAQVLADKPAKSAQQRRTTSRAPITTTSPPHTRSRALKSSAPFLSGLSLE